MHHPFIIDSSGKAKKSWGSKGMFASLKKTLDRQELTVQKIMMNLQDLEDVLKWSKD